MTYLLILIFLLINPSKHHIFTTFLMIVTIRRHLSTSLNNL